MKVLITVIFLFSFLDKTDMSLPLSWSSIADEILPNVCESLHDYYFILIVYKLINQLKQQPRDQVADRLQFTPCGVNSKRVRHRIRLVFLFFCFIFFKQFPRLFMMAPMPLFSKRLAADATLFNFMETFFGF